MMKCCTNLSNKCSKIVNSGLLLTLIIGAVFAGSVFAETQTRVHKVEIVDFQFAPKTIEAKPGDTIQWTNRDIAPHTATSSNGGWDTDMINMGESKTIVVSSEMNLNYICKFHPSMKGMLVVKVD